MKNLIKQSGSGLSRRKFLGYAAGISAMSALPARYSHAAKDLNVLVWCDHADELLLKPFEEAHGVKVNVKSYEGTGTALSILEQSSPGEWDVLVVDAPDTRVFADQGMLEPLDDSSLPLGDLFKPLTSAAFNYIDGVRYAVPEKFGYYGVAYNKEKVDEADMRSAQVMWNDKYKGRVAVYDYYFPAMQLIAISMGVAPEKISMDDLPTIREKLLAMKPNVKLVGDVVGVQNALVNGDVDIVLNGAEFTVSNLMPSIPALDWAIFDEGGLMWIQGISVFKDSNNKDLAVDFLNHILSPQGQGTLATSECYWAMPASSQAVLNDDQRKILRWDEQAAFMERSVPSTISDPDIDAAMLDIWTEFLQS